MYPAYAALLAAATAASAAPVINGEFTDWDAVPVAASDPAGDASGPFDLRDVKASGEGSRLAVKFDIAGEVNLNAGSSSNGSLFLRVTIPGGDLIEVDFRGRRAELNGSSLGWDDLGWAALPTFAATSFETVMDLAPFGVGPGDTVSIQFAGRDQLAQPVQIQMGPSAAAPAGSYERPAGTQIRVASLNTLQTGLFDNGQDDQLARLIDAVDADVYCIQEEYDSSANQIRNLFNSIDPLGDGASWSVIKADSDEVLVTHLPMTDGGNENFAYVTGLIDVNATEGLLVMSIHPKCCGSIGSSEDDQRVDQHQGMAATIADYRAGQLARDFPGSPVLVVGDWNLVGGRAPLDVMLDPGGPDLSRLPFPLLGSGDEWTWRDLDGFGFPPGRLDLGVYSADSLTVLNSFALDTELLSAPDRSALGVQSNDSRASDHLMLVADIKLGVDPVGPCGPADITTTNTNPGDENYGSGDGQTDGADLSYYVENWLTGNAPVADVTTTNANPGDAGYAQPDGTVDGADLSYFVEAWLAGCG